MSGPTLRQLLQLEQTGSDRFRGLGPEPDPNPRLGRVRAPRLYGGIVAGQSTSAACATVAADRRFHSLHAYFLRPGSPGVPVDLAVDRVRDGRSFSTRVVTARQGDEVIFVMTASFHIDESGDEWQPVAAPVVPGPDEVADDHPLAGFPWPGLLDVRAATAARPGEDAPLHPCWVRTHEHLGDDPTLQASAMAFLSDLGMLRGDAPPDASPLAGGASIDHAFWLHRPAQADQWLLVSSRGVVNHGARGLLHGSMHDRHGLLVASMSQEGLLRPIG